MIVLLDEIQVQRRAEVPVYTAIIESTVSRTRPVLMAATTTILGMVPLLFDVAFGGYGSHYYIRIDVRNVTDSYSSLRAVYSLFYKVKEK